MSPTHGDAASSPEIKSSSGFASVIRGLTGGGKSSRQNIVNQSSEQRLANVDKSQSLEDVVDFGHFCQQLRPGNLLQDRIDAAEALKYAVQDQPVEGVASIFNYGKDLIDPRNPEEARGVGYALLTACVKHERSSEPERSAYFQTITASAHPADFHLQLNALTELASHGKNVSGFHYQIIPLLTKWLQIQFEETCRQRKNVAHQQRGTHGKMPVGEETTLSQLFAFIVDVVKFNIGISSVEGTSSLLDVVLHICVVTPISDDLKACISVIDAIVTYGEMPADRLEMCIKVLCSIYCLVNDVQREAWRSICAFCTSHHGQKTVLILLNILRDARATGVDPKQIREIRGAISVLGRIFAEDARNRFPLVPFTLLMQALMSVISAQHAKIDNEVLHLVSSILSCEDEEGGEVEQQIKTNVLEEEWTTMFAVVKRCSNRTLEGCSPQSERKMNRISSTLAKEIIPEQSLASNMTQTLKAIVDRVVDLLQPGSVTNFSQREACIKFLIDMHHCLPTSGASLVIDHYVRNRYCFPSDLNFEENIVALANAFLSDRHQMSQIRLQALKAIRDVYPVLIVMDETDMSLSIEKFISLVLNGIAEEKDLLVMKELVNFAVQITETASETLFSWILDVMRQALNNDQQIPSINMLAKSELGSDHTGVEHSLSYELTRGLVHIFMKTMDEHSFKSLKVFKEVLWVAKTRDCQIDARVQALKMLFRLRADWAGRIFLTPFTESDGLAAALYRTEASRARRAADEIATGSQRQSRGADMSAPRVSRSTSFGQGHGSRAQPTRSISGAAKSSNQAYIEVWMSPDPKALPEQTSGAASHVLFSFSSTSKPSRNANDSPSAHNDEHPHTTDNELLADAGQRRDHQVDHVDSHVTRLSAYHKRPQEVLDLARYLQTITSLLRHGCDFEVYTYILVHLPSQLTNQALFRNAIPEVKALRSLLCEQIRNNSFQEPPRALHLLKSDLNVCVFQSLNMVMSYHKYFSKAEDDEMVQTFIKGLGEKTSKSCVHALSICCHELPNSTSRNLMSLLQRMSQIITQNHVAVHILEFLSCLARLPHVYVNFREEEFRIVFAICFRYLDYARDQNGKEPVNRVSQISSRASVASADNVRGLAYVGESNFQPNASDDLPQYVYALAYHVIIFWFLSLKLEDRAGQVSWIAKSLIATDINGKESIDEQAQVTLDFIQRVTYADVEESKPDPDFTSERFGKINKYRWIIGNTLVTIEQLHSGDWGQITKRQPSGTSCYIIREKYNRPFAHQIPMNYDTPRVGESPDVVLPSHLLVQIVAGMPQASSEAFRPIPLPMDDTMDRSVKMLDRITTVDSYKVGVIYIGENQTEEAEILANESGSSDYTEFLHGLGTVVPLKGATFNTQGLDTSADFDGEFAVCWRDRVTEIIFHATTEMPTRLADDPRCIHKKRHIGNDFVNIIFNNSGLPFKFDTFPSDFNYVNIVIAPESRETFLAARNRGKEEKIHAFYKVQVMSKPGFPEISPAAETKIMGISALPRFIRLLALNASVFSLVWSNRHGDQNVGSWRSRLREINRLRERYSGTNKLNNASNPTSPPSTASSAVQQESNANKVRDSLNSLRRSSVANFLTSANTREEMGSQRSSMISTAETEVPSGDGSLHDTLDFSKWAAQGKGRS